MEPEDSTAAAGQAPAAATGQEPGTDPQSTAAPAADPAATPGEPQGGEPGTDPDAGQEPAGEDPEVKRARNEAASYRRKLREAEAKLKEREEAELSEQERLAKRLKEAEERAEAVQTEARQSLGRAALIAAAAAARFRDPADAVALVGSEVEFGDDGEPTNAADLVARLAKDRNYLIQPTAESTSPAAPAQPGTGDETDEQKYRRIIGGVRTEAFWDPKRGGVVGAE